MTGQDLAAMTAVAIAGAYLLRSFIRTFRGKGGCSCEHSSEGHRSSRSGLGVVRLPFVPIGDVTKSLSISAGDEDAP